MEVLIISVTAFIVAILTFFWGFGLVTILTPGFMIFFPVDMAIGLTGIVHFFNYIYKLFLLRRKGEKEVLFRFFIAAFIA